MAVASTVGLLAPTASARVSVRHGFIVHRITGGAPPAPASPRPRVYPLHVQNPAAYDRAKSDAARAFKRYSALHPSREIRSRAAAPLAAVFGSLNAPGVDAGVDDRLVTPPDTTGSIGPDDYVELVNAAIAVYPRSDLTGAPTTMDEDSFVGATDTCDGQIQWDQQGQRWLYASLACGQAQGSEELLFGWSKTPDPTPLSSSNWCGYSIDTGSSLEDYPKLGHDDSQIIIGTNSFDDSSLDYTGSDIWMVDKPGAGDTSCPSVATLDASLAEATGADFTPVPANIGDSSATGYVVALAASGSDLTLYEIGRAGDGSNTVLDAADVTVSPFSAPASVPQASGDSTHVIDTSDARLTQAVAVTDPATGKEGIWTQHTIAGSAGGPSVVRWYELTPGASSPRQEGTVSGPDGTFAFNGAISPTADGRSAAVFYNSGDATHAVDLRVQDRQASTPLGTTTGDLLLATSPSGDIDMDFSCNDQGRPCRWGDYAGASPDPVNRGLVWGTGELNSLDESLDSSSTFQLAQWGTQNAAVDASSGPEVSSSAATAVSAGAATLNGSVNPQGHSTTYHFEYGTTTAYGASTPTTSAGAGTANQPVSAALTGLSPSSTYHYRLVATSSAGTSATADRTFATAGAPPVTPPVTPSSSAFLPPLPPTITLASAGSPRVLSRRGSLIVSVGRKLSCPQGGSACTAAITLVTSAPRGRAAKSRRGRRKIVIGRAKVTVPAGRTRVLTIKLNRRGARLLAKAKRLKVTITISARIGRGASITSRRAATLRAPAKLRRR